jgi:hypothetical protein
VPEQIARPAGNRAPPSDQYPQAWIGYPLAGDHFYSKDKTRESLRLGLHNYAIGLAPLGQEKKERYTASNPVSFTELIEGLDEALSYEDGYFKSNKKSKRRNVILVSLSRQ